MIGEASPDLAAYTQINFVSIAADKDMLFVSAFKQQGDDISLWFVGMDLISGKVSFEHQRTQGNYVDLVYYNDKSIEFDK